MACNMGCAASVLEWDQFVQSESQSSVNAVCVNGEDTGGLVEGGGASLRLVRMRVALKFGEGGRGLHGGQCNNRQEAEGCMKANATIAKRPRVAWCTHA